MIKKFIITGDTHGQVDTRLGNIARNVEYEKEQTAVIILGDAGVNFYCNKSEKKKKHQLSKHGMRVYCVRGNHEERPENLDYEVAWDEDVHGNVYMDPDNANIRYFMDGGEYNINGHSVLTIGGAYSVDKYWRLQRAAAAGQSFSGWFKDEQLTPDEMEAIGNKVANKDFDFVFTHTCPFSWEPTDLFLGCVDQSTVETGMELWMDELRKHIGFGVWCFGHFHADRVERPCVEQFYWDYEDMEVIWNRWHGQKTWNNEWWLDKSPMFYSELDRDDHTWDQNPQFSFQGDGVEED